MKIYNPMAYVAIITFPWQLSMAATCTQTFNIPGHVLLDHVIQSFIGTSSADSCLDNCGANSSCHSINWHSNTGLCQLNQGTHLSYPEGLVASDSSASYKLYSLHSMVTCSNRFCSDPDICLMNNDGISYRCERCNTPLGMQSGAIPNSHITASTIFSPLNQVQAWRGRLHNTGGDGGWVSKNKIPGEWLQIELNVIHLVSKVATQGRANLDNWVTKYSLKYSQDGANWESYKYWGNTKAMEFKGNSDRNTVVTNKLPLPIKTKFIRFVAVEFSTEISMRVELYGCIFI